MSEEEKTKEERKKEEHPAQERTPPHLCGTNGPKRETKRKVNRSIRLAQVCVVRQGSAASCNAEDRLRPMAVVAKSAWGRLSWLLGALAADETATRRKGSKRVGLHG